MKNSIIIPVYQRKKALLSCVSSILHQAEQDFELIIVDDGTTEYKVIDVIACMVKQINYKIIRFEHRKSFRKSQAINTGCSIGIGEIIHIIDVDIVVGPDYLRNINLYHGIYSNLLIYPRVKINGWHALSNEVSKIDNLHMCVGDGISGICSFRREWFYRTEGFNNTYTDWGGEDSEFHGVALVCGMYPIVADEVVTHLSHSKEDIPTSDSIKKDRILNRGLIVDAIKKARPNKHSIDYA